MASEKTVSALKHDNRGFTLVELVVAAFIIGIAVIAVVAVARKSRDIDITFQNHQRAGILIDSVFESQAYHYYNDIPLGATTAGLIIEERPAGNITGTLTVTVTADSSGAIDENEYYSDPPARYVYYKKVAATLSWTETGGEAQSLTMTRAIPEL